MQDNNKVLINSILIRIEQKLNWGTSESWLQRDFENLIDEIFNQTKVAISLSTIKRIWKGNYKNLPNVDTLNALAQFAGYNNWQTYKASCQSNANKIPLQEHKKRIKHKWRPILFASFLIAILLVLKSLLFSHQNKITYNSNDFELSLKSVTSKTPNTIYFKYKIPAYVTDTVYLQQNWDKTKRMVLNKNDTIVSSIYYYPSFYKTKMVVNDSVMREIPLQICSEGWQCLISYNLTGSNIPIYINKEYCKTDKGYHVSIDNLKKFNVDFSQEIYWTEYINSKDFPRINSSNFSFEVAVKNPMIEGGMTCQDVMLYFVFEDNYGAIPLCETGCVSNLEMYFCGIYKNGKTEDLSAFGIDLNNWNTIKCSVKDKELSVFINNEKTYKLNFFQDGGKLKYIEICFKGSGFMKNPKLFDSEENLVSLE
jgi:hypothetical protein